MKIKKGNLNKELITRLVNQESGLLWDIPLGWFLFWKTNFDFGLVRDTATSNSH